jgi:hypothetical protein
MMSGIVRGRSGRSGGVGGTGTGLGNAVEDFGESDPQQIARQAIEGFEFLSELSTTSAAREALIRPAVDYHALLVAELDSGAVTPAEIIDAVQTVLRNAEEIAIREKRDVIDETDIREAMKLGCRHFPWC